MSNLTDFFGASIQQAPIPYQQMVIGQSKTWTVPRTGKIKVMLTGGGGQGAFGYSYGQAYNGINQSATGGGAGGLCSKIFDVTAGETFTITIGAGGDAGNTNISYSLAGGSAGTSTFVTGTAATTVNMSAGGGGGGNIGQNAGTVLGGLGGTCSGGDDNLTGGRGGNTIKAGGSQGLTTGGGAVALYGTAYNGGDINFTDTNFKMIATGGAGVGGHGGSFAPYNSQQFGCSDGGSATKDALSNGTYTTSNSTDHNGVYTAGAPTASPTISIVDAQGAGGRSTYRYNTSNYTGSNGNYGGGGGATVGVHAHATASYAFTAGNGGGFAGGGGCTFANQASVWSTWSNSSQPGAGGTGGGGSGGLIGSWHGSTNPHGWYAAPDGLCIISYI